MTDPAVVAEWVRLSCASQRLPLRVTDPGVLTNVAGLLGTAPGGGRAAPRRSASVSGAPDGREAGRIETVVATPGGCDGDVVDDGGDDGGLLG